MLEALFGTPAVTAIVEALRSIPADGKVAVIGDAKLAAALADAKRDVLPVGIPERAAKKLPATVADLASVADGSLAAVIGVDIATDDSWQHTLREWTRVVRDGGAIVSVDRGHAPEATRRVLCSGVSEIEQRHAGRTIVTSGVVTHL